MDIWQVKGGNKLMGSCDVQGSKNASLPILAASIISPMECRLYNLPKLRDVDAAMKILRYLGCKAEQQGNEGYIDSRSLSSSYIPPELMEEMRSSVIFMGALLARCGECKLSPPGGCQLGKRPIDLHLKALEELGADIEEDGGEIFCRSKKLKGGLISFPFPSVGATENLLLASCRAEGKTIIHNAAREPEISALADFLRAAGADIKGDGSSCIEVSGFRANKSVDCRIIPDRIVASSFACACAACGGDIEIKKSNPSQFSTLLYFLNCAGCDIINGTRALRIKSQGRLKAIGPVSTAPYPGFPTDAQPLLMAALLKAEGESVIEENIFQNRYRQVPELLHLGADISLYGKIARIRGVEALSGSVLQAGDLRGGASMLIAALSAEGESVILDSGHIRRGYEDFDLSLKSLGAELEVQFTE